MGWAVSSPDLAVHRPLPDAFLRLRQVCALTGLSRATIYRRMDDDTFPHSVPLMPRVVVWLEGEVRQWMAGEVARHRGAG